MVRMDFKTLIKLSDQYTCKPCNGTGFGIDGTGRFTSADCTHCNGDPHSEVKKKIDCYYNEYS